MLWWPGHLALESSRPTRDDDRVVPSPRDRVRRALRLPPSSERGSHFRAPASLTFHLVRFLTPSHVGYHVLGSWMQWGIPVEIPVPWAAARAAYGGQNWGRPLSRKLSPLQSHLWTLLS